MAYLHRVRIFYMLLKQFSVCLMCLSSFTMLLIGKTKFVQWFIDLNFSFCSPESHSDLFTDSFCIFILFYSIGQRFIHFCWLINFVTELFLYNFPRTSSNLFTCSFCDLTLLQLTKDLFRFFFSDSFFNMTLLIPFPKD